MTSDHTRWSAAPGNVLGDGCGSWMTMRCLPQLPRHVHGRDLDGHCAVSCGSGRESRFQHGLGPCVVAYSCDWSSVSRASAVLSERFSLSGLDYGDRNADPFPALCFPGNSLASASAQPGETSRGSPLAARVPWFCPGAPPWQSGFPGSVPELPLIARLPAPFLPLVHRPQDPRPWPCVLCPGCCTPAWPRPMEQGYNTESSFYLIE